MPGIKETLILNLYSRRQKGDMSRRFKQPRMLDKYLALTGINSIWWRVRKTCRRSE